MLVVAKRTRQTFEEKISIHDPKTQDGYKIALNSFENFCMEKYGKSNIIDDLKESKEEAVYDVLQGWINWAKLHPSTVRNWFSCIKRYLHYMGIKLHQMDIKENLIFPKIHEEEKHPLQLEEITKLFASMRFKVKLRHLCQLSSLMRIGEQVQLRKRDLVLDQERIMVKIPARIAKFKRARTTFFSKEAGDMLKPLLKKLQDDDLVFGTNQNAKHSALNCEAILRKALVITGLTMRYETNNRYKINTHSFRAYGYTKVSRHDPNFAKMIAGQKGYLIREYDRLTDEEKLNKYIEVENDLLIYKKIQTSDKVDTLEKRIVKLEKIAFKRYLEKETNYYR